MDERVYPFTTQVIGKLFFGWCKQGAGAPVIDTAHTSSVDGWSASAWVIRFRRTPGRAFQVGWKSRSFQLPPRRLQRTPIIGRLFRARY
jgi:hypothetical protein